MSNTRWCNLSNVTPALQVSKFYNVRVRPVINGTPFCYGNVCQIGIATLRPNHSTLSSASRMDGSAVDAHIYPNPSSTEFNLTLNSDLTNTPAIVTITDLSGRVIETFNFECELLLCLFRKTGFSNPVLLKPVRRAEQC